MTGLRSILRSGAAALALAAILAAPASAQILLAWNDCITDGGLSDISLPCSTPGTAVRLYCTFGPTGSYTGLESMDFNFGIGSENWDIPEFWQFATPASPSSCNPGLSVALSPAPGTCSSAAPLWGAQAVATLEGGLNVLVYYPSGTGSSDIAAGTTYFCFGFTILTDAATESGGSCGGCQAPMTMGVNLGVMHFLSSPTYGAVGANCVTTWGSTRSCEQTPARAVTWGRLKALYR